MSKKKFRTILSNPPISAGIKQVVGMFVNGAVSHLEEKGTLQIVIQSNKGGRILSSLMEDAFGQVEILDRSGGYRVLMSTKN